VLCVGNDRVTLNKSSSSGNVIVVSSLIFLHLKAKQSFPFFACLPNVTCPPRIDLNPLLVFVCVCICPSRQAAFLEGRETKEKPTCEGEL